MDHGRSSQVLLELNGSNNDNQSQLILFIVVILQLKFKMGYSGN